MAVHLQPQLPSFSSPQSTAAIHSMETGQIVQQESALHAGRHAWWPLDTTMACSLDDASTMSSSSSFLLGWDPHPHLCYFGLGMVESPVSEASTAAATGWTMQQKDATAMMPGELDELLMSLWDSDREQAVGFSSCCALKEASATSSQRKNLEADLLSGDHHHSDLSSILLTAQTSPDKALTPAQAELSASSSSRRNVDPRASDTGGAQQQHQTTRASSSSKRSAPEEEGAEGPERSKRGRKAPCSTAGGGTVARPFTVVKPGGADGSVTLADINRRILTPPARPVRHPVGEFACAPRVSAGNRPAPSGKTVAGFTRLRTAGGGTITIVRTRG